MALQRVGHNLVTEQQRLVLSSNPTHKVALESRRQRQIQTLPFKRPRECTVLSGKQSSDIFPALSWASGLKADKYIQLNFSYIHKA